MGNLNSTAYAQTTAGRFLSTSLHIVLCLAFGLSIPLTPASGQLRAGDVRKENAPSGSVMRDDFLYSLTQGDVRAVLGFRSDGRRIRFEVSKNGNVPASADMAAARKMEFLKPLLQRFFAEQGRAAGYTFVMNYYTEMGTRMADEAVRSKEWDVRAGRAVKSGNDFVLTLLKRSSAPYAELAATAEALHYSVTVGSIENRIVLPFREFSSYEKTLMTTTPGPGDKLPCGASVFFEFTQSKE